LNMRQNCMKNITEVVRGEKMSLNIGKFK
jgi:hypothetical protein